MDLNDLRIYRQSMELSDKIWSLFINWQAFEKYSLGKQFVEAADSVSANISEGFGRFHFKDSKNFLYYSRGSLSETKTWLEKAYDRNLIAKEDYLELSETIKDLGIKLNNYINTHK